jgi:hypothetical protein
VRQGDERGGGEAGAQRAAARGVVRLLHLSFSSESV